LKQRSTAQVAKDRVAVERAAYGGRGLELAAPTAAVVFPVHVAHAEDQVAELVCENFAVHAGRVQDDAAVCEGVVPRLWLVAVKISQRHLIRRIAEIAHRARTCPAAHRKPPGVRVAAHLFSGDQVDLREVEAAVRGVAHVAVRILERLPDVIVLGLRHRGGGHVHAEGNFRTIAGQLDAAVAREARRRIRENEEGSQPAQHLVPMPHVVLPAAADPRRRERLNARRSWCGGAV
jgi:hypothetical protein